MKYHLAIDIGASSGRHIVGWRDAQGMHTREVYRFPNAMRRENGHLVWNLERLEQEVKKGIQQAKNSFEEISSLAIDTWGVDYVCIRDGKPVGPCYAYRDHRTEAACRGIQERMPFPELYSRISSSRRPRSPRTTSSPK